MSRRDVINTLERAVSTDIVRLQSFRISDEADALRYLLDWRASDDRAGGDGAAGDALTSPLRAAVLGGLTVKPDVGSVECFVDSGALIAVNTFSGDTTDDSPTKVVSDKGVPFGGVLELSPNSSGATRIDVVECSIVQANIEETDSRDVFNPLTGAFAAVSLPKVTKDILTYRIRQGTPGSGFPGTASGWLPLMVASVPDGSTTWDTCTLWDVRPLSNERVRHPHDVTVPTPGLRKKRSVYTYVDSGVRKMSGFAEAEAPDGYILGGDLNGLDGSSPNLTQGVSEPGWALADGLWYLYVAAPFGLPRWARYTLPAFGQRVPSSPRGIPIFSQTKHPDPLTGRPVPALGIPNSTGLGGTTQNARLLFAGSVVAGGWRKSMVAGEYTRSCGASDGIPLGVTGSTTETVVTLTFTLRADEHFPSTATRLRLRVEVEFFADAGGTLVSVRRRLEITDANGDEGFHVSKRWYGPMSTAIRFVDEDEIEVELPQSYAAGQDYPVTVTYSNSISAAVPIDLQSADVFVAGWSEF